MEAASCHSTQAGASPAPPQAPPPTTQHYDTSRHDEFAAGVQDLVRAAIQQLGLGTDTTPGLELISREALLVQAAAVCAAFPDTWLHAYAIKANPLAAVLRELRGAGFGAEVASREELVHAQRCGWGDSGSGGSGSGGSGSGGSAVAAAGAPIVYDSPCKTRADLEAALRAGCLINLDNVSEVETLADLLASGGWLQEESGGGDSAGGSAAVTGRWWCDGSGARRWRGAAGLRLNAVVGAGAIAHTSTATAASKFGEALSPPARADALAALYAATPWLTAVHGHVGSQGCALEQLVAGARALVDFAARVNAAVGRRQVVTIDVGGGLSANYTSDDAAPPGGSFFDYARALRAAVPELFNGSYAVVTEFGRAVVAKAGVTLSAVAAVKDCGGVATAVVHTGANQFVRTAYRPSDWFHRVTLFDASGAPARAAHGAAPVPHNIVGPLCFSGDLLARALPLPRCAARGDVVCVHDSGAYTTAMYSMYNSRTPLPVYMWYHAADGGGDGTCGGGGGGDGGGGGGAQRYVFVPIKVQTLDQTLAFWQ